MAVPAILLVVGVAVLAYGLLRSNGRPKKGSRLRVLFSGETMGELEPCNCSGQMAGGLPVRGGYIETHGGPHLLLDIGCIGNGVRDFELLRTRAAVRGMAVMGYDAANVGEHELWLGRDKLLELTALGVPFVSANVLDDQKRPVVEPYRIVRRSGLRIAVTGVVDDEQRDVGPGLHVDPPREVLARLVPKLSETVGVIIVLADLELDDVRDLATDFPEIALILFRGREDSQAPERVNRTVIASIYGEARYLGDLTLTWESRGSVSAKGEAVLLDERFGESRRVINACTDWYKEAVRGRTFDLAQPSKGWERIAPSTPERDNGYVGSTACRACHEREYAIWSSGPHAGAMESLQTAGYDFSPECVVCHVTGYAASDGYVSMENTHELGNVGCEACHGRGRFMLNNSHKGIARTLGETTCRQCHMWKRDPTFDFETDWALISHGRNP
jgi:hypothetical protein